LVCHKAVQYIEEKPFNYLFERILIGKNHYVYIQHGKYK
jgi:hypothetical protein